MRYGVSENIWVIFTNRILAFCNMTSGKVTGVVLGLLLGGMMLYLVASSMNEGKSDNNNYLSDEFHREVKNVVHKSGTFMPDNWTGLPISYDNDLFIDPTTGGKKYQVAYSNLVKTLLTMPRAKFMTGGNDLWDDIANKYCPIIGWNGYFDAVLEAFKINGVESSPMVHALGEILGQHATRPRHAVEVASRDILHKAPLHGSVWVSIEEFGASDIDKMFDLVNNELCFFKTEENMGNIWISCAHGVGHGLGGLYGLDDIEEALTICASQEDSQFQYACATGIFMALENETPLKSFFPCDTNTFPGACYRFKNRLFGSFFYNTTNACSTQSDLYHTIGCIWGEGHVSSAPPMNYFDVCAHYLPTSGTKEPEASYHEACLDGFFASHEVGAMPEGPIRDRMCKDLMDYPKSYDVCMFKMSKKLTQFTFDDETVYYNTKLLERYHDSTDPVHPARWLAEWENIIPNGPQMMNTAPEGGHNHGGHGE